MGCSPQMNRFSSHERAVRQIALPAVGANLVFGRLQPPLRNVRVVGHHGLRRGKQHAVPGILLSLAFPAGEVGCQRLLRLHPLQLIPRLIPQNGGQRLPKMSLDRTPIAAAYRVQATGWTCSTCRQNPWSGSAGLSIASQRLVASRSRRLCCRPMMSATAPTICLVPAQ